MGDTGMQRQEETRNKTYTNREHRAGLDNIQVCETEVLGILEVV